MLLMLTDTHISPKVAKQIIAKQPEILIYSLYVWRKGKLLEAADEDILLAAHEDNLTLVKYDQNTIPSLITKWGLERISHSGVIFVSNRSIAQDDVGEQIRAILNHWNKTNSEEWKNRVSYLQPALYEKHYRELKTPGNKKQASFRRDSRLQASWRQGFQTGTSVPSNEREILLEYFHVLFSRVSKVGEYSRVAGGLCGMRLRMTWEQRGGVLRRRNSAALCGDRV